MEEKPTFSGKRGGGDLPLIRDRLRDARLGAYFRPRQLEAVGVGYDRLRCLVAAGSVERVTRGLYRFTDAEATEHHSLAAVSARVPKSIVCLLSALLVHGIGTQLPQEVWLAIPHKARLPRVPDIRLRIVRFSGSAWTLGVTDIELEGVPAHVTNPTRTVVDCFRFERLVGREAAMEALRDALDRRLTGVDELSRALDVLPSRRLRTMLDAMFS